MRNLLQLATFVCIAVNAHVSCCAAPEASPTGEKKLRVVVFGGHPDDPESGCGGLIALLTANGHEVVVGYATYRRTKPRSKRLVDGYWSCNPTLS